MQSVTLKKKCDIILSESFSGVVRFEALNNVYWLKRAGENKDNFIRRVSAFLGRYNSFSIFDTKATLCSKERIQHEKRVLNYLYEKKFATPKIEFEGDDYFVTLNSGTPLNKVNQVRIQQSTIDDLFILMGELHSNNIAHGRPTLRDIVIDDNNKLRLLDFEEAIINPSNQQIARDVYILLLELSDLESITASQKTRSLLIWKEKTPDEVWHQFVKISRYVRYFVPLAHLIKIFKKRNRLSQQVIATVKLLKKIK